MKYEFKQINLGKSILLLSFVMFIFFVVPIIIFGFNNSLDFINSFESTRMLGFIVGIVVILPALFLKRFIGDKIELSMNNGFFQIKKNEKVLKETNIKNIDSLVYSDLSTKILDIFLKDKTKFYQVKPNSLNAIKQVEDINKIINIFKSELDFDFKEEIKKKMGQNYKEQTYVVKNNKNFG